jgi:hypothetical protein
LRSREIVGCRSNRFTANACNQFVCFDGKGHVAGVTSCAVSQGDVAYEAPQKSTGRQGLPARIKVVSLSHRAAGIPIVCGTPINSVTVRCVNVLGAGCQAHPKGLQ